MIHVWGRGDWGEWTNITFSLIFFPLFFFFFKLLRLNYVWYIKDHVGLMKPIYDFMSKICPSAPLKLTHRPLQQNWSGSFWSGGRGPALCREVGRKSRFPSHSSARAKGRHCRRAASVPRHALSMGCSALEGRLLLAGGSSKDPCGGGAVPGKGEGTSQHLSRVLRADLTVCTITHPTHIQRAASWGWRQMHTCPQILGEIICDYFTSQNFPNNVANWEGKRER